MGESRNAYRVLVGRPEGKRLLGRPRRRWEDIKMDLREVGYDGRDWINLAQDRDQWQAYVRTANEPPCSLKASKFIPRQLSNMGRIYSKLLDLCSKSNVQEKKPEFNRLSKEMLGRLECPACLEYLRPPIRICKNGHSVCGHCRYDYGRCPFCRENFLEVTNTVMENITRELFYPCPNEPVGCKVQLQFLEMEEHKLMCPLTEHCCPFGLIDGIQCRWKGLWPNLKRHAYTEHNGKVIHMTISLSYFMQFSSNYQVTELVIMDMDTEYITIKILRNGIYYATFQLRNLQDVPILHAYKFKINSISFP
ncbi:hypothetical protein ANN_03435 [Periplaneta americana]|uniref:RING-type E3 ubiquitin transferase n=1 Tax=Periplaneta americana TaxID=6978 RepID=A0ABQ8U1Z2_PERAM|nr:hypothetical protein ANN_03435 [Periplaneta americana]